MFTPVSVHEPCRTSARNPTDFVVVAWRQGPLPRKFPKHRLFGTKGSLSQKGGVKAIFSNPATEEDLPASSLSKTLARTA